MRSLVTRRLAWKPADPPVHRPAELLAHRLPAENHGAGLQVSRALFSEGLITFFSVCSSSFLGAVRSRSGVGMDVRQHITSGFRPGFPSQGYEALAHARARLRAVRLAQCLEPWDGGVPARCGTGRCASAGGAGRLRAHIKSWMDSVWSQVLCVVCGISSGLAGASAQGVVIEQLLAGLDVPQRVRRHAIPTPLAIAVGVVACSQARAREESRRQHSSPDLPPLPVFCRVREWFQYLPSPTTSSTCACAQTRHSSSCRRLPSQMTVRKGEHSTREGMCAPRASPSQQ